MELKADETFQSSEARVLVIDDDEQIRIVLTDALSEMGHSPETATSGDEAIKKASKQEYDLILLDLVLPRTSGQDVFETIKTMNDSIPIIIITGYGSIDNAVEFLKNGAVDYLTKPINLDELKVRINRALVEKRLKEESIIDLKTQLFNHNYFEKRLQEELKLAGRYGHSISLLMLDLDDFKQYNDRCGHPAGDVVLMQIGKLLKKLVRDCDIPCRFGGEEFTLILPETNKKGAAIVAERIRSSVDSVTFNDGSPNTKTPMTVSVGTASYRPHKETDRCSEMELLIQEADKAMYKAKRAGKNRVTVVEIPFGGLPDTEPPDNE